MAASGKLSPNQSPAATTDRMTEGLILALIASLLLLILGLKMRRIQIIFISSLGWMISALQVYDQTNDFLPTALLLMISISQFFILSKRGD